MDSRLVVGVSQSLFVRRAPDGHRWEFAATASGGCAVLCDGDVVMKGDGSEETIEYLLREFLVSSGRCPLPGAPVPAAAVVVDDLGPNFHAA